MSTLGSVRVKVAVGSVAALGVLALCPILRAAPSQTDSSSSRSEAPKTTQAISQVSSQVISVKKIELSEPIPYPTLRKSSSELRSGTSKTVRAGINGEKKSIYKVSTKD